MFEFGKTFNMKSVWIWITNLKPYYVFNMKSVWIVSISKGRSLLVFLRSGMHFLAVGSNIRIVALSASLTLPYESTTAYDENNRLMKHRSLFSSIMDLKRDMSWKSRFLRWGVFQVILKPDKTTDWRNTDHCFLVS